MPLDTKNNDLLALRAVAGCAATFVHKKRGPLQLIDGDPAFEDRAATTSRLWQSFAQIPDAEMMIWREDGAFSVALRKGGLILQSRKPFNIGLARKQTEDLRPVAPTLRKIAMPDQAADRAALWALAERLGRVEAPRLLEMMIGEQEYVVKATRSGFGLIDDANGVEGLVNAVKTAVADGGPIEYTLGSLSNDPSAKMLPISALFCNGETGCDWQFDHAGWPEAVPEHARFDTIATLRALAATLGTLATADGAIDVLDGAGRSLLNAKLEAGSIRFRVQADTLLGADCRAYTANAFKRK